jgi:hypothetical protein
MADVVYCDTSDLCQNNYYFPLSTPSSCNPTNLPTSHTGIAEYGASGIYFASNAPVANLNPTAPSIGVRMANGQTVRSVASAMLASAPSLPPAAMQGHVMPSFPHTLIGLGPFANLGRQIVFSKHAVLVIHPDGHSILDRWRKQDGPRLWCFPLKATMPILPEFANYEKLGPRGSTADSKVLPPARCKPPSQACWCPRCLKNMRNRAHAEALPFFLSRLLLTQFSAPPHFPCLPQPVRSQQLLLHNPIPPRDA